MIPPVGPVTKNVMILLGIFFIATLVLQKSPLFDVQSMALYSFDSPLFRPYQLVTNIFLGSGFISFLLNLLFFYLFGSFMENVWGSKRFTIFILSTTIVGAILANCVTLVYTVPTYGSTSIDAIGYRMMFQNQPIFGIQSGIFAMGCAFAILFPNYPINPYGIPLGIKAKYLFGAFAALEIYSAWNLRNHGGAPWTSVTAGLVALIIIFLWSKHKNESH
jgi:membrane associated rhomboid family serine protease